MSQLPTELKLLIAKQINVDSLSKLLLVSIDYCNVSVEVFQKLRQSWILKKNQCPQCQTELLFSWGGEEKINGHLNDHSHDHSHDNMWAIQTYYENAIFLACNKCERYFLICPECNNGDNYEEQSVRNFLQHAYQNNGIILCKFLGHSGYFDGISMWKWWYRPNIPIDKFMKEEDIEPDNIHVLDSSSVMKPHLIWDYQKDCIEEVNQHDIPAIEQGDYNTIPHYVGDLNLFSFKIDNGVCPTGPDGGFHHYW